VNTGNVPLLRIPAGWRRRKAAVVDSHEQRTPDRIEFENQQQEFGDYRRSLARVAPRGPIAHEGTEKPRRTVTSLPRWLAFRFRRKEPFAAADRNEVAVVVADLLGDAAVKLGVHRHDEIAIGLRVRREVVDFLGIFLEVVEFQVVLGD
jgi:hypothetical protein